MYEGYPDSYVLFMAEAKKSYEDICERIAKGDVPYGSSAKVGITVPPDVVNRIRFEILAAETSHG